LEFAPNYSLGWYCFKMLGAGQTVLGKGENEFIASDGHKIYCKVWIPDVKPLALVLMFHGLGDHISRYDHVFSKFEKNGIIIKGMVQGIHKNLVLGLPRPRPHARAEPKIHQMLKNRSHWPYGLYNASQNTN
jgi:hypothetical protein